jgi:hypothetical protein
MSITPRSKKASPREANSLDASIAARASAVIEIVDHGENPAVSTYLLNCPPVASAVHFAQHKKKLGRSAMKRGVGDDPSRLTTEAGKSSLIISEGSAQQKKAASELFFVDCNKQSINTEMRDLTFIYLSFTYTDISIALAGCGVTLEGGTMRWPPGPL